MSLFDDVSKRSHLLESLHSELTNRNYQAERCVRLNLGKLQGPQVRLDPFQQVVVDNQSRRGHFPATPAPSTLQLNISIAACQTTMIGTHHVMTLRLHHHDNTTTISISTRQTMMIGTHHVMTLRLLTTTTHAQRHICILSVIVLR